jgi:hypothetical protein
LFGFWKILKFLDFYRTLSLRRQFFSAGSACGGNFLAQAQHAQKKNKNGEYLPLSTKKKKISPVLKSPTHIGFIDVKKMGRKSHTWALSDLQQARCELS